MSVCYHMLSGREREGGGEREKCVLEERSVWVIRQGHVAQEADNYSRSTVPIQWTDQPHPEHFSNSMGSIEAFLQLMAFLKISQML